MPLFQTCSKFRNISLRDTQFRNRRFGVPFLSLFGTLARDLLNVVAMNRFLPKNEVITIKLQELMTDVVGFALFLAVGIISVNKRYNENMLTALGAMCIITAAVFLIDFLWAMKNTKFTVILAAHEQLKELWRDGAGELKLEAGLAGQAP